MSSPQHGSDQRVTVVGTGYVGLPLAVMLAKSGYEVRGCDVEQSVVEGINSGVLPHIEDDLAELLAEPVVRKNLTASTDPEEADIFVISVPTPLERQRRVADLSFLVQAVEAVTGVLKATNLIVIESTIPPLTCRTVVAPLLERAGFEVGQDVFVAHCPERILPGNVVQELLQNDRIIGARDVATRERAMRLYASFVRGRLLLTDDVTAELTKLMENTYRDVNIALANEFAAVAAGLGVSVMQAIELANHHPRVDILDPGIGTGGHCIPIDPWFIQQVDPVNTKLLGVAREVNMGVPEKIASRIRRAVRDIDSPAILAVGQTYKPDTYDTRESPAIEIVGALRADGYSVGTYDPYLDDTGSLLEAARGADLMALLVEHKVVLRELEAQETAIAAAMRHSRLMRCFRPLDAFRSFEMVAC